jgi:signal peptidase I
MIPAREIPMKRLIVLAVAVAALAACGSSSGSATAPTATAASTATTLTTVTRAFYVLSGSMMPTLQIGDRILVVTRGYTIHRGDIIVFRRTPADTGTTDADLIKRVIGLPGETISSSGNTVLINGRPLKEPWLPSLTGLCAESAENTPLTKIAPGHYFVMGDCRGDSADSRVWGTVPAPYIVGKVENQVKEAENAT